MSINIIPSILVSRSMEVEYSTGDVYMSGMADCVLRGGEMWAPFGPSLL